MCRPVNAPASGTIEASAAEFAEDRIGPCGRRCSECRAAAMMAGLTVAASRTSDTQVRQFVRT